MPHLKKYQPNFKPKVLRLFDSNVPQFFDPSERDPFEMFLKKPKEDYYVLMKGDEVIGAGGYCAETEQDARICWLMIDSNFHRKGYGKFMMVAFEKMIEQTKSYNLISLKTAQSTEQFYAKLGYVTTYFEKDHWAKGLDLYLMKKEL